MTVILCAAHLPNTNGMPADQVVNTFVFGALGSTPGGLRDVCAPEVANFYTTPFTAPGFTAQSIGAYLGSSVDRGADKCRVETYTLQSAADSLVPVTPIGSPIGTSTFTMPTALGTDELPREVAACLSYHGNLAGLAEDTPGGVTGPKGDTHPAARKRGRLYLGPLNHAMLGAGVNGPGVKPEFRSVVTQAARALALAVAAALEGLAWMVWSRVAHSISPILGGFMDDAFDTQRRRGISASTRTLWTLA